MSVIALEGMRFRAHHGYYEEEQILGGDYIVDVRVTTNTTKAAIGDDLEKTINYETIYLICEAEMKQNAKLLENVAERISLGLRHQFKYIKEMTVRVKKLSPPLGGPVEASWVEVDGQYTKKCGRCGRPMLCYSDKTCWCMETQVFKKTLEQMKTEYGNQCLCKECLQFFAGTER